MPSIILILSAAILILASAAAGQSRLSEVVRTVNSFRDCLHDHQPVVCFKEKAVDVLNETIYNERPMNLFGVEIGRNPSYDLSISTDPILNELPEEPSQRSSKLSDLLHDKIEQYFRSRTVKFNLDNAVEEGRGKKGGGGGKKGGGGMMMLGMLGMGCMMAQLMLGKVAFLAGSALIIAKLALFLSAIIGLKKLASSGGGGGETQHVVYAASDGHSHGGGWHRSYGDEAQNLAYRAHIIENNVGL